jgi:hypothetical protein
MKVLNGLRQAIWHYYPSSWLGITSLSIDHKIVRESPEIAVFVIFFLAKVDKSKGLFVAHDN